MVSGVKGNKKKQKMAFAKDKKQAVTAFVVLGLFILNTIIMTVKGIMANMPQPAPTQSATANSPNELPPPQQNPQAPPGAQPQPGQQPQLSTTPQPTTTTGQPQTVAQDANNIYSQTVDLQKNKANIAVQVSPSPEDDNVEILAKGDPGNNLGKFKGKMVTIDISNSGRSNPFLPASEDAASKKRPVKLKAPPFLTAPPEFVPSNPGAARIMTTTISGILYDKYNPSAIINIEGTDYLVKRGDIINGYRIISIGTTQVLVQLGSNVYKAGVGQLLSLTDLNYNTVANLNKKFGGSPYKK